MAIAPFKDAHVRVTPLSTIDEAVYKLRLDGALLASGVRFPLIDLFAGAGGLTLGFSHRFGHCFEPVWANDFDRAAARTYEANFGGRCFTGDILDILNDPTATVPPAEVVIGGPPCQGSSLLNKKRAGDPRKQDTSRGG